MMRSSTKARMRFRMESISGGRLKSMVRFLERIDGVAAIDHQGRAGHMGTGRGGEQQQRAGQVLHLAEAALRDALDHGLPRFRRKEVPVERRFDIAWSKRIHPDAMPC